ncbi:hypothetical protein [Arachidicoccus terrestris]|uniref:hypothetical protein n=1 Tax=Arachidicoccus terrestris TaxID=2875539 RepID=UPI001CC7897E|nr:hypothetical protein [Arachidicoccus terrestris]UAY55064.1 hypothetical protein K9M52_16775 [Arachidicoccus terrestris]
MKKSIWLLLIVIFTTFAAINCGSGDRRHLNDNPNDLGMPDSATYSDSPMPGQPNGYAPAGSEHKDSTNDVGIDSATKGSFQ